MFNVVLQVDCLFIILAARSVNTFTNGTCCEHHVRERVRVWSISGERFREHVYNQHTASHKRIRERINTFTEQVTCTSLEFI